MGVECLGALVGAVLEYSRTRGRISRPRSSRDWSVHRRLRATPPVVPAGDPPAKTVVMARDPGLPPEAQASSADDPEHHLPTDAYPMSPASTQSSDADEGFELGKSPTPEGHALYLKGRVSGQVFRVSLARDPAEPRSWCLFVEHRASVGVPGRRTDAVIGPGRLTREDALKELGAIEANPNAWLSDGRREKLLDWMRTRPPAEAPPDPPRR